MAAHRCPPARGRPARRGRRSAGPRSCRSSWPTRRGGRSPRRSRRRPSCAEAGIAVVRARALPGQRRDDEQPDPHPVPEVLDQHADGARPSSGRSGWSCTAGTSPTSDDPRGRLRQLAQVCSPGGRGRLPVPILIENTAGGDNAMARRLDALARLWDAVGEFDVGFCLDTCHAHAAGEELARRGRPGQGDHRPDRPGAPQRLPGRVRLRRRPAREPHRRARSTRTRSSRCAPPPGAPVLVETPARGPGRGHRVPARAAAGS